MKKISSALVVALLLQASAAQAAASEDFMVSGVLRKGTDGVVIKLVHGVESAMSANEAVGTFTRKALGQYPGYSLVDAIASPLKKTAQPCTMSRSI